MDPEEKRRRNRVNNLRRSLRVYGLTMEQYEAMLAAQGGVCAICRRSDGRALHIDHDHGTGKVRALLCGKCNPAIGAFDEDVGMLRAAIEYLERHRSG